MGRSLGVMISRVVASALIPVLSAAQAVVVAEPFPIPHRLDARLARGYFTATQAATGGESRGLPRQVVRVWSNPPAAEQSAPR